MGPSPPYLVRLQLKEGAADGGEYPFSLPLIRCLDIEFTSPVTFFVGENGTGKSTVIEAIAALCKLPVSGGGRNELAGNHGPDPVEPACAVSPAVISAATTRRILSPRRVPGPLRVVTRCAQCRPRFQDVGRSVHASMEDGRSIPAPMAKPFCRFSRIGFDPGYCCSTSRSQRSRLSVNWRSWRTCPRWWRPASRSSSSRLIRQFC